MKMQVAVDHFYSSVLSCLALNESEAGVDLVLIISSLFLCKLLLISMRRASFTQEKQEVPIKKGHLQPHFHSKARQPSKQLQSGELSMHPSCTNVQLNSLFSQF